MKASRTKRFGDVARKSLAFWAESCAEHVLPVFAKKHAKDDRRPKPSRPRAPGHVEKLDVGRRVPPPLPPMLPPAAQMTPRPEQTPGLPAMLRRPRTWQATPGTPPAMPLRLQPKPAVSGGCSSLGGSSSS